MSQRLEALQAKVDDKFKEIQDRYQEEMQCRRSCFQCCRSGLSISRVEQQLIRAYLLRNPEREAQVKELSQSPAHGAEFCSFLTSKGACSIYEVRPIICRSHGAPILFKDGDSQLQRDVCTLNFQNLSLEAIADHAVINIELLNTLLALINQTDCPPEEASKRFPLNYKGVIHGEGGQNLMDIVSES